jgi:hypothetical protein
MAPYLCLEMLFKEFKPSSLGVRPQRRVWSLVLDRTIAQMRLRGRWFRRQYLPTGTCGRDVEPHNQETTALMAAAIILFAFAHGGGLY